jgi:hypothetical protein
MIPVACQNSNLRSNQTDQLCVPFALPFCKLVSYRLQGLLSVLAAQFFRSRRALPLEIQKLTARITDSYR